MKKLLPLGLLFTLTVAACVQLGVWEVVSEATFVVKKDEIVAEVKREEPTAPSQTSRAQEVVAKVEAEGGSNGSHLAAPPKRRMTSHVDNMNSGMRKSVHEDDDGEEMVIEPIPPEVLAEYGAYFGSLPELNFAQPYNIGLFRILAQARERRFFFRRK